jgi:5'-nucleotidase/UDP-sugar diphosphatase
MTSKMSYLLLSLLLLFTNCTKKNAVPGDYNLTIFIVNDPHAQIDNFSQMKHIVEEERKTSEVIVACAGDIFSGNPVVDNYTEKGYPIIDIMNKVGFDVTVVGNHEFDYGTSALADRINQSDFDWICANVDMGETGIPQPEGFTTLNIGDFKVTFLGLLETNGKPDAIIPSTHPFKLEGITFERPENVVGQYAEVKQQEDSDLYIALTHLGHDGGEENLGDFQLAHQFPYFDVIIGGHSSKLIDTVVNNIPIFQVGRDLEYLGKIKLAVKNKKVDAVDFEVITLSEYPEVDAELQNDINTYHTSMADILEEVIGTSMTHHERYQVGCFYTDALRARLDVDLCFQNYGGVRSDLDAGEITVKEIYQIDPFNNGTRIYNMSVSEIETFLRGAQTWICYSGVQIDQIGNDIEIRDLNGNIIPDDTILSIGINDYIPAVYDSFFPINTDILSFTTAEAIIHYLKNTNNEVNYPNCERYFIYD